MLGSVTPNIFLWQNNYVDNFETQLFAEEIHRKIWYRSLSLTNNEEDAKDLLQDTFLRALEKKDSFDGHHLDRWLYTICRNIFLDNFRKKSYTMKDGNSSIKQKKEMTAVDELPELTTEGEQSLVDAERDYETCLRLLGSKLREVMSMSLTHSYEEICEDLGISHSNLRIMIHRARASLASCMGVLN